MKFNTITATFDDLERFYNGSALTIEGLSIESFKDWIEFLKDDFKENIIPNVYSITGSVMNAFYGLEGTNAYPEDLTLAVIELDNFEDSKIGKISIQRFNYGGRWFDDIVDNKREEEN